MKIGRHRSVLKDGGDSLRSSSIGVADMTVPVMHKISMDLSTGPQSLQGVWKPFAVPQKTSQSRLVHHLIAVCAASFRGDAVIERKCFLLTRTYTFDPNGHAYGKVEGNPDEPMHEPHLRR